MSDFDPSRTVVIANPASRGGWVSREWSSLTSQIRRALGDVQFEQTRGPRDATAIATKRVEEGAETIISLGGDGTHGEVADGIASAEEGRAQLGILHAGTGGDFRRTLRSAEDLGAACDVIKRSRAVPVDLGRVDYLDDDGEEARRHFLNLASVGMAGMIDRIVANASRRFGAATYAIATLKGSLRYRPARVRLTIDGASRGEFTVANICICNGRYAGGGMMFAPNARLCDGLFDVIVIESASTLRSAPVLLGLYRGAHVRSRLVQTFRGAEIVVTPLSDDPAWMDIDGEAPGTAPATFTVLPGALPLLGVPEDVR